MRPVIINGKFLSAAPTGVHRVAAELANALADLKAENHPGVGGLNFSVVAPYDGQSGAAHIRLPVKIIGPLRGIPWEQLTLPLRKGRRLLLNLCNIGPGLSRDAVTMIHDVQVHISPASYARRFRLWYRFIQPLFARRHRHILTVSEFSRQEIARIGLAPLDRITVVHNGVDHMLRVPADATVIDRLTLDRAVYVVALSTTQVHKNIAVLLKAFADPALVEVKLVLFGSADGAAFADAGMGIPPNVIFAGRISDGELRALLEHALCLAFPSTTEGFGLPPLEAMVLGCPAIVAPCGALPEVCGDAAGYASPSDASAWSAEIARMYDDADFRQARVDAGRLHAGKYTWREAALTLSASITRLS
jgi:glycosyltransferase involved in cell wall biosynthesis